MSERKPGRILAFEPGFEVSPLRPAITADVILDNEAGLPRQNSSLDEIQINLLEATNNILPDELIDQLGLSSLRWQLIKQHNGLAGIFLGAGKDSPETIRLQEALGVIEVRSTTHRASLDALPPRIVIPQSINVSGMVMDTSGMIRAVGCSFSSRDFDMYPAVLRVVHVSVSDEELPPVNYEGLLHDVTDQYNRSSAAVPSQMTRGHYSTAALITEAQIGQTLNHHRAIELRNGGQSKDLWLGLRDFGDYPNPGFWLTNGENSHILGFDPLRKGTSRYAFEFNNGSNISTWEIDLPRQLVK